MGGKGGGGGDYYAQPPDTSGYGTPEEAKITLAKEAPLDLSQYQQTVNTQKAAALATAPDPIPSVSGGSTPTDTGSQFADAVLKVPDYWKNQGLKATATKRKDPVTTTQT
jgi:hypothetical protein